MHETMLFGLCFIDIGALFFKTTHNLYLEILQGDCGTTYLQFNVMLTSTFNFEHNYP